MVIQNPDRTFTACLQSEDTDIFIQTWAPSTADLNKYPHVMLGSSNPWNPRGIKMPVISTLEQEEIEVRNIYGVQTMEDTTLDRTIGHEREEDLLFNVDEFQRRIISSVRIPSKDHQRQISGIKYNDLPPPVKPGPLDEFEIQARTRSYPQTDTPVCRLQI
jgi:hypothetical protein